MKNAIIFVIALAMSNLAVAESPAQIHGKYSAPFGLEWGLSKEQVTAMGVKLTPVESVKDSYTTKTLPKNLSDAEEYYLIFKQGFGLVVVYVFTSEIIGDVYGSKGRDRYSQLKTAIVNKYGKPSDGREKMGGILRPEDIDKFYECLKQYPCGLWISFWGNETDGRIILELNGIARGRGFVDLRYESAAYHTARKQEAEEKSRSDEDAL